MNYVSLDFWLLLGCLAFLYLGLRLVVGRRWGTGWDRVVLLGAGFALFGSESPLSFGIFVGVGLWVFGCLELLRRVPDGWRWRVVGLGAVVALLPLVYYKYWSTGREGMLIPIGISFYTFQLVGMLVDSARKPGERVGLVDFFNFASFFPQIVAGPIERRDLLLPQLREFRFRFRMEDVEAGLQLVVTGLFYKLVVADNLAGSSGWITGRIASPWLIHFSNLLFGLRIYFDFCGYSLIALGLGRMLGVELTMNFLSPYTQRNIQEFWRTWHVSLSRWFRDYVYVPLGGNRAKHPAVVLMVVFLVSGVWHGAGWNFVLWGAAHGILLVAFRSLGGRLVLPGVLAWGLTMALVSSAWLFFYQLEAGLIGEKLRSLVTWQGYLVVPKAELTRCLGNLGNVAYVLCAGLLGVVVVGLEWMSSRRGKSPHAWAQPVAMQAVLVMAVVWLAPVEDNGFVYFNF